MTRKHFKALADSIKALRNAARRTMSGELLTTAERLIDDHMREVANLCHEANGMFNRTKFYLACDSLCVA